MKQLLPTTRKEKTAGALIVFFSVSLALIIPMLLIALVISVDKDDLRFWIIVSLAIAIVAASALWLAPEPTPEQVALREQKERARKALEREREIQAEQAAELIATARFAQCPFCACSSKSTKIYQCLHCSTVYCTTCGGGRCPRRSCKLSGSSAFQKWLGRIS